jgi:hypothetical protein
VEDDHASRLIRRASPARPARRTGPATSSCASPALPRATLLIDLDYGGPPGRNAYWHTAEDTLDKLSAESLRITGTVILEALPAIEAELARRAR